MKIRSVSMLALTAALAVPLGLFALSRGDAAEPAVAIPFPAIDEPVGAGPETVVFAGGCFWGVQGVFQHVKGVESAIAGYAGGTLANPSYQDVGSEQTGHAESVKVTFDPKVVTYGQLLQIFFSVVQNPTELNYQGPDSGPSYRSAVFTTTPEQKSVADAYVAQLDAAKAFPDKIVTEVTPYTNFYQAEDYHQDYATLHPDQPYIAWNDLPKIANLKAMFPAVWRDKPVLVFAANAS